MFMYCYMYILYTTYNMFNKVYPIFSHCTCRRLYRGTKVPLKYIYMVFGHVICFCESRRKKINTLIKNNNNSYNLP